MVFNVIHLTASSQDRSADRGPVAQLSQLRALQRASSDALRCLSVHGPGGNISCGGCWGGGGGGSQKMGAKCLARVTHSKKGAAGVSGPVRGRDPEVPEGGNPRPSSTPRTSISPTVSLGKRNGDTEEGLPPAHRVAGAGDPHVFGLFLSVYILPICLSAVYHLCSYSMFFFFKVDIEGYIPFYILLTC